MTTKWKAGQSGNPAGRPRGSGRFAELRDTIAVHIPEIIAKLAELAKEGDATAAKLLLERVYPAMKPVEAPQPIPMPDGTLTDRGKAVLEAIGAGELAPAQGASLVAAIGALARVVEVDELAARVAALEDKHAKP